MIHDLKPYPSMKDSGVPWLGEVPEHWDLSRLGAVLRERGETNADGRVTDVLSVVRDRGVIPYAEKGNIGNKKSDDITRYKVVRPNDIVVNCMNVIIGSVGLSKYTGCLSPVYYVLTRRSESDDPRYLNAYFQTKPFQLSLVRIGNGILAHRMRIPMELLKCEMFPRPPLPEQAAIVRFLDHVDRRIRSYIHAKQKLIKLLEEQKQAIIHRAVTRGLDPNVRIKPSGVEWLGDVPEHWEVVALKRVSRIIDGDRGSEYPTVEDFVVKGIPFLSSKSIKRGKLTFDKSPFISEGKFQTLREGKLRPGDLVMTVRGTIGNSALFSGDLYDTAFINAQMMIVRPRADRILSPYLLQLTQSRYFKELLAFRAYGSAQQQLTNQLLSALPVPLPPIVEQEEIAFGIAALLRTPDEVLDRAQREISFLREYRTRLIADVVTGKLDVREAAARLPDEPEEPEPLDEIETLAEGNDNGEEADLDANTAENADADP